MTRFIVVTRTHRHTNRKWQSIAVSREIEVCLTALPLSIVKNIPVIDVSPYPNVKIAGCLRRVERVAFERTSSRRCIAAST